MLDRCALDCCVLDRGSLARVDCAALVALVSVREASLPVRAASIGDRAKPAPASLACSLPKAPRHLLASLGDDSLGDGDQTEPAVVSAREAVSADQAVSGREVVSAREAVSAGQEVSGREAAPASNACQLSAALDGCNLLVERNASNSSSTGVEAIGSAEAEAIGSGGATGVSSADASAAEPEATVAAEELSNPSGQGFL